MVRCFLTISVFLILLGCETTDNHLSSYFPKEPLNTPKITLQDSFIDAQIARQDTLYQKSPSLLQDLKIEYKKKMIKEAPYDPNCLYLYGRVLGLIGEPEESFYLFQVIVKEHPKFIWAWHGIGVYYLNKQLLERARGCFETILEANPDFVPGIIGMAKVAFLLQQESYTLTLLRKACKLSPDSYSVCRHMADVLITLGHTKEAIPYLERVCELNKEDKRSIQELAKIQGNDSEDPGKEAIEKIEEVRFLKSKFPEARIAALRRLARRHCYEALPYIFPLLEDNDPRVRAETANTLAYLGQKTSIPHLIKALSDRDTYVQNEIIRALKDLTGKSFKSKQEWEVWWNKEKKEKSNSF